MSFFAELQRRRVFRVFVGYGVVAFGVLQAIEPIMHALHLPDVVLTYVVVGLGLGFPVAVVLAWAFDVNAGRIERTPVSDRTVSGVKGPRLALVLVGIGALAAAPGIVWYFLLRSHPAALSSDVALRAKLDAGPPGSDIRAVPSIAVLPFADMSEAKDQEYFADGLTEELLNVLTQVDGLHVAGRTSSFAFKGKNEDLGSIAQKLHVATLLEGSVRKAGNRLRITTQLISAADGYHLWSQTYDRELKDIFAVQEEIARAVVAALRVKLIAGKSPSTKGHSTDDMEAYRLYLSGKRHWLENNEMTLRTARVELEKAIALDPHYGPAWETLAPVEITTKRHTPADAKEVFGAGRPVAKTEEKIDVESVFGKLRELKPATS